MTDEIMAEIGRLSVAEHAVWKVRNEKRRALHAWLREYRVEADGDYFDRESAEATDRAGFDRLMSEKNEAQRAYSVARAATRRAIVRAAAALAQHQGA